MSIIIVAGIVYIIWNNRKGKENKTKFELEFGARLKKLES